MTAAILLQRRMTRAQTAVRQVVQEVPLAVRAGIQHVASLSGLNISQRIIIVILKLTAIMGYLLGKWRSYVTPIEYQRKQLHMNQLVADAVDRAIARVVPMQQRVSLANRPLITVVIPIYCVHHFDRTYLMSTMDALSQQTRQPDCLVLVDDGSPLQIPSIISGARVLVVRLDSNCGPAVARNAGILVAKKLGSDIVAFLDADCIPKANWLECMALAQCRQAGIVCGRTMSTQPQTYVGLYHDVFGTLNGRQLASGLLLYGCTCNLSIDLDRCGLEFDGTFPQAAFEDVEFCVRASNAGVPMSYDADAIVHHHYDTSPLGLFRQFARYGQYECIMSKLHPNYLCLLQSSVEISSLSAAGLKLEPFRDSSPSDKALCQEARNGQSADTRELLSSK